MRTTPFIVLIAIVALSSGLALPALAQTSRIAHFSHGGSFATLEMDEEPDNFGIPMPYFVEDSIRLTSDTTALAYGSWMVYSSSDNKRYKEKTRVVELGRDY